MAEVTMALTHDELHPQGNSTLNNAKYSADNTDEWYTTYETIAEELEHYEDQFEGSLFSVTVTIRMNQISAITSCVTLINFA